MKTDPWSGIDPPDIASAMNALRVDPQHPWDFFWARDIDHRCLLVMRLHKEAIVDTKLPTLRGVSLRVTSAPHALVMTLADGGQRDIFLHLCHDIIDSTITASSESAAFHIAVRRTWRWHHLLRNASSRQLSESEQQGLIGELLVLERYLLPVLAPSDALACWRGPLDSPKDFEVGRIAIEAKARRGAARPHVTIGSEHQLDRAGVSRLFLHVVDLTRAPVEVDDGFALTDVVERVWDLIATRDSTAADRLDSLLLAAGYSSAEQYRDVKWVEGTSRLFEVGDDFPAIAANELPNELSNVSYSLSLVDLTRFVVSKDTLLHAIGGTYEP